MLGSRMLESQMGALSYVNGSLMLVPGCQTPRTSMVPTDSIIQCQTLKRSKLALCICDHGVRACVEALVPRRMMSNRGTERLSVAELD